MTKIKMLGTGHGGVMDLYNTCFAIENETGVFLVDTGGSIEIIRRLKLSGIDFKSIKNIFISHSHTDHILGLIWMLKRLGLPAIHGEIKEKINIYCNDVVCNSIKETAKAVLPGYLVDSLFNVLNFVVLENHSKYVINDVEYEFFDIISKDMKQFGFRCLLDENKLVFLGDEPLNESLYDLVRNTDYVMHEAFCLESEVDIFNPYEKNHSTALSTARVMNKLDVKNLILYHTEESHGSERKALYTKEAKNVFAGKVIVPDDLEVIQLVKKRINNGD